MTQDEIIEMARQAGFHVDEESRQHQPNFIFHGGYSCQKELEAFTKLVAAKEREACDNLCQDIDGGDNMFARAIRARGEA
jgi:hypothetical protein